MIPAHVLSFSALVFSPVALALVPALAAQAPATAVGEIAFSRGGKILLVDVAERTERVLVEDNSYDRPLYWLPDGSRLVYWNHDGGAWDLWAVSPATGERKNLTGTARDNRSAGARPDGRVIAFHRGGDGVWLMGADGSQQTQLHELGHRDIAPVWSPSGNRLAFAHLESAGENSVRTRAYLVGLAPATADDGATGLTPASAPLAKSRALGFGEPMFFLDESRVVIASWADGHAELVAHDLESGERRALTKGPANDLRAVLSEDRKRIAWIASTGKHDHVMVMRADGSESRVLAELDAWWAGPSFSPDGEFVTFESGESRRETAVWIVPVAGGEPTCVVEQPAKYPVWRPRS